MAGEKLNEYLTKTLFPKTFWPIFTSLPVNLITDKEFCIHSPVLASCIIIKMKLKHLISLKSDDRKILARKY